MRVRDKLLSSRDASCNVIESPDIFPELEASNDVLSSINSPNMLIPYASRSLQQPSPTYNEIQFVPLQEYESLIFGELLNTTQYSDQPSVEMD